MNILEKDIENVLFATPSAIPLGHITGRTIYSFEGWIARQYSVPSGRIDLLGLLKKHGNLAPGQPEPVTYHPLIVELKRDRIDAAAIAQVGRYLYDIREIIEGVELTYGVAPTEREMFTAIVGKSADYNIVCAAQGFGISLLTYEMKPFFINPLYGHTERTYAEFADGVARLVDDGPFEMWRQEAKQDRLSMGWPAEAIR